MTFKPFFLGKKFHDALDKGEISKRIVTSIREQDYSKLTLEEVEELFELIRHVEANVNDFIGKDIDEVLHEFRIAPPKRYAKDERTVYFHRLVQINNKKGEELDRNHLLQKEDLLFDKFLIYRRGHRIFGLKVVEHDPIINESEQGINRHILINA